MFIGGVILTGGTGSRLGGADKASLLLDGKSLLEHALAALEEVPEIVVVGEECATSRLVRFTREQPARTGPAAAVIAGVRAFPEVPDHVVVLAVDMPRVTAATIRRLMLEAGREGAVLVDKSGKRQHLCGVYSGKALLKSAGRDVSGLSMKALLKPLKLTKVPAVGAEARDVDTWAQLNRLQR